MGFFFLIWDTIRNYDYEPFFKNPFVQGIAFFTNVFSIAYALIQAKDSRRMTDRLESQTKSLENISDSLTTKYLGEFPDFMDRTIKLLEGAKKSILIVCDYPCYGYFSSHDKWFDYSQILERKIRRTGDTGVKVTIKFLSSEKRRDLMAMQFRYEKDLPDKWITGANADILQRLQRLLSNPPRRRSVDPLPDMNEITFNQLQNLLEDANKLALDTDFAGATTMETEDRLPIYFWIVDDEEAIFSIPSFVEYDSEKGFRTTDLTLIKALTEGQESMTWKAILG